MMTEIIRELTVIKNINKITLLDWAKRVEVQRAQNAVLDIKKQWIWYDKEKRSA